LSKRNFDPKSGQTSTAPKDSGTRYLKTGIAPPTPAALDLHQCEWPATVA
jgi:hypothetical protein